MCLLGKDFMDAHDIGIYKSLQAISSKGSKFITKVMLASQRDKTFVVTSCFTKFSKNLLA